MLAHDRHGDGADLVVLLHSVGGGRQLWGDQGAGTTRALAAAGFAALAVDLPGYGDSPLPDPLTTAAMADAVAQTVRALGYRRAALVGHSMGGMVAQDLAVREPGLVQALVLACTSPAFGKPGGDWQQAFLRDRLAPLDAGQGMAALARQLVCGMVGPHAPARALDQATASMARVPEATYRAALRAIVGFDRRSQLGAIGVPTLCLAGEHDRTAAPRVLQGMAGHIPGARWVCIEGAGHIAHVERPEAFNAAVVGFLGEVLLNLQR